MKSKDHRKPMTIDHLAVMATELTDARMTAARMVNVTPAPGVNLDLDLMEARYMAAVRELVEAE